MARFYSNENFPFPVVEALREMGHDVLTVQETGMAGHGENDEEVLGFAHTEGRAILTLNRRHFIRLHGRQPQHSGIVVCTFDPEFASLANRIHEAVKALATLCGMLIRVNRPGG